MGNVDMEGFENQGVKQEISDNGMRTTKLSRKGAWLSPYVWHKMEGQWCSTSVDVQHFWMPEFSTVKVLHRLFLSFASLMIARLWAWTWCMVSRRSPNKESIFFPYSSIPPCAGPWHRDASWGRWGWCWSFRCLESSHGRSDMIPRCYERGRW